MSSYSIPFQTTKRIAVGQHTTASAQDTVTTGLQTVDYVVCSFEDDPVLDPAYVIAEVGNQIGAPAAGTIYITTFKHTSAANPTPATATVFGKKVNWFAVGT